MALNKSMTTNYGVNATYWLIANAVLDPINGIATVVMSGYANQTSAQALDQPLSTITYQFTGNDYTTIVAGQPDSITAIYNQVSSQSAFSGSIAV